MKSPDVNDFAPESVLITDGGPARRIMKCVTPVANGRDGKFRAADSASFLTSNRLSINISVSSGCVGKCALVCPSGLPNTFQGPMFNADEMVRQVDAHLRLRGDRCNGRMIDVGTFADGDAGSNEDAVLEAAQVVLLRDDRIDHIGVSTIGVRANTFFPKFIKTAQRFKPGRCRFHYSYYGPDAHDGLIPPPAPPIDAVFEDLAGVGRQSGFPVTLNIPMIAGYTDTDGNMQRTAEQVSKYSNAFRVKLSTFNTDGSDGGSNALQPSSLESIVACAQYLRAQGLLVKIFFADIQDDGTHVEAGCGRLNIKTRHTTLNALENK